MIITPLVRVNDVLAFVVANPGCAPVDIYRHYNPEWDTLPHHSSNPLSNKVSRCLRRLLKGGYVRREATGVYQQYLYYGVE